MGERAEDDKDVEDLVAVPRDVKPPGAPLLGHPLHVERCAHGVEQGHGELVGERDDNVVRPPVERDGVRGGDDTWEAHGEEEPGAEGAEARCGEGGGEERGDDEEAEGGDGGEVEEAGEGAAGEGVEDGGEEGGDDHEGDAGVVEAPEEEVEAPRVRGQKVGHRATHQARHWARQEDEPWPYWDDCTTGLAMAIVDQCRCGWG